MLRRPKLLFLDEPTNAMDRDMEAEVVARLRELNAAGTGLVLCTHRPALADLASQTPYNLELRVSLDGSTEVANDRLRGRGVFAQATAGIAHLARAGLSPIVAVTLVDDSDATRDAFVELLTELGVERPRVKWIPPFRIGREGTRKGGRPYTVLDRLTAEHVADPEAPHRLQCGTSRTVTSQGVFPCPILINEPSFRLGDRIGPELRPHRVDHPACTTCWAEGFSCSA